MNRRALLVTAVLALACGACRDPFARMVGPPPADEAALAHARRMDRIEALIEARDHATAQRELDAAFADGFAHPRASFLQGRLHLARGGRGAADALPWLQKAIEQSPHWPEPRRHLAEAYIALNRLAAAENVLGDYERLFPEHPVGPHNRAVIAVMQGRDDDALVLVTEALRRDLRYAPALRLRAKLAAKRDDRLRQREFLERYLAEVPHDAAGHAELAGVYEQEGRLVDARRAFARSYQIAPDRGVAGRIADLARRQGDAEEARRWQERAR